MSLTSEPTVPTARPVRQTDANNAAILEHALRLSKDQPFSGLRMETVAEAAGVGKVTIYRYYPTKADLYEQVLIFLRSKLTDAVEVAVQSNKGCINRLIAVVAAVHEFLPSHRLAIALFNTSEVGAPTDRRLPPQEAQEGLMRTFEWLLALGVAKKEFAVDDIDLAVRMLLGAVREAHCAPCVEVSRDRFPEILVRMVTRPIATGAQAGAAAPPEVSPVVVRKEGPQHDFEFAI